MTEVKNEIFGNKNGRRVGPENCESVHKSQWYPEKHPGTCQVPYLSHQISINEDENKTIREIWNAGEYNAHNFSVFDINEVPSKYKLAQVLACGLKATNATYSQHWEGMYFDWTFNNEMKDAIDKLNTLKNNECYVENAFATVVLINTGYKGAFFDMLRWRRRPVPPSMYSLENIDMGTFECNLKNAVCSVLGGEFGVNIIRQSFSEELIDTENKEGYDAIKKLITIEGMVPEGKIATIMQIGFKKPEHRRLFDRKMMDLAGAKLIERKSERRNADFSINIPESVMNNFFTAMNKELKKLNIDSIVKYITVNGDTTDGRDTLNDIRDMIVDGLDKIPEQLIAAYEDNLKDGLVDMDREQYVNIAHFTNAYGKKVLKPREDAHKMVFIYIEMDKLLNTGVTIDVAEHAVGDAIQAGLNSIHLDGTTEIPEGDDLKYGAFCLTGPLHSAEVNDTDAQLQRGYGHGFWDILAPELPHTNKMLALIAISAKREQDAMIAEKQAMEQRKSVNDIFWYKTWNHPQGKKLDVPNWISYAHLLHILHIPDNDIMIKEYTLPDQMPAKHPITEKFRKRIV